MEILTVLDNIKEVHTFEFKILLRINVLSQFVSETCFNLAPIYYHSINDIWHL